METPAKKRFVAVPADRLVKTLDDVGAKVIGAGGFANWKTAGRERVFEYGPPGPAGVVRVFTTLAVGADTARGCGADAVRIVVGYVNDNHGFDGPKVTPKFRPLEKGKKMLRTAPRDSADRVGTFLERLTGALRAAYARARDVRSCPKCGGVLATRKSKHGPFLGCTAYPDCRHTEKVG